MRYLIPAMLMFFCTFNLTGQNSSDNPQGKVSYVTTQNVYVKFQSTANISPGDTLFMASEGNLIPALTVKEISSISCVCTVLAGQNISVGDQIISRRKSITDEKSVTQNAVAGIPATLAAVDTVSKRNKLTAEKRTQHLTGNLSVASYLNFSDVSSNSQRMRYTFAMVMENIGNSKISAETYISFAHKLGEWTTIQDDIFNGLKIYSFSIKYEINAKNTMWLGRKINPRISNAGAIDGLQYELKAGSFTVGLFGGFRPDYTNYSFNASLPQFGGYLGHDLRGKNGSMQTTLAFINQMNSGKTDRRFAYLQHTNALIRNMYFFGSVEVDLYQKTINQVDTVLRDTSYTTSNSPHFSNLYLSLRYRPVRQLSLSISYSARENVIYYETYKNYVDRLLEAATVNGVTFQVNYQPVKLLSIGFNAGYRDSKNDPKATKNIYGYVTYSNIPGIDISATASATYLETSYMSGPIFGLGISRDLVPGKLSGGLDYRYVSYNFYSGETKMVQHMGEVNLTWRILKKLSCGFYYEGTFDKTSMFNRVYLNVTQRF